MTTVRAPNVRVVEFLRYDLHLAIKQLGHAWRRFMEFPTEPLGEMGSKGWIETEPEYIAVAGKLVVENRSDALDYLSGMNRFKSPSLLWKLVCWVRRAPVFGTTKFDIGDGGAPRFPRNCWIA